MAKLRSLGPLRAISIVGTAVQDFGPMTVEEIAALEGGADDLLEDYAITNLG